MNQSLYGQSARQRPRKRVSLPLIYRYGGAIFVTLSAAIIRFALMKLTGSGAPFVLFFGATLITTYLFGRGPGYLSGLLGALCGACFFMPSGALHVGQLVAQAGLFLLEAVSIAVVTDGFATSKMLMEMQARALEHSESHYRVLTEISPQVTWEADVSGHLTYINQYWQDYAHLTATQSLGAGFLLAIEPKERRRARAYLRLMMRRARIFQCEVKVLGGPDGRYRWHLVRGRPVTDEAGQVHKWVGVAMDIEEQKRAASNLQTAVRTRDHFLSTASHELKTPLTSMQLMMQMMRRNWNRGRADAFSPEKLTRLFEQIEKSVQRLTHIINDMLDVSRISSGKLIFNFEPTELGSLVRETVERLAGQIEASGVAVTVSCEPKLIGHWDHFRLEQVITNLIINAIRYGEGAPINIEAISAGMNVRLSVRDFGPGVPKEMHQVIFHQFERGLAANPSGGLGLGLFLCRQIIERHGGQIRCVEHDGPGAQFEITLPYRAALNDGAQRGLEG